MLGESLNQGSLTNSRGADDERVIAAAFAEDIDDLLDALVRENLLSDERFTESFVRFRMQRHQGPLKIRAALSSKGVPDMLISRELDAHADQWRALAAEWLDAPVKRIADRAREAGKIAGAFAFNATRARAFNEVGYRFIVMGPDQAYLMAGIRTMLDGLR